ncbi:MAG: VanZ family protein [Candidatus Thiodiazotropha sp.]
MTGKSYSGVLRRYLMALGLSALTYLLFTLVPAYAPMGDQLLVDPGFSQGLASWRSAGNHKGISIEDGVLSLQNASPRQNASVYQCFDRQGFPAQVLARIEARTDNLILGEKAYSGARVGLLLRDADGTSQYQLINRLVNIRQARTWTSYEAVLMIPEATERVCFRMTLLSTQGTFQLRNPTLNAAHMLPSFRMGWWILLITWATALWIWSRQLQRHYLVAGQSPWIWIMIGVMALGILMSYDLKMQLLRFMSPWLPVEHGHTNGSAADTLGRWLPMLDPGYWDISKFSHLIGFTLLSLLLFQRPRAPALILISGMLVAAVCSEALQFFAPGRTPRLNDLLVDSLGILAGWWMSVGIVTLKRIGKRD